MSKTSSGLTVPEIFDLALTDVRNRGYTTTSALEQVSEFFGVSPSRIKRHVYGGDDRAPDQARIYDRYLDHLTTEEQHARRKLAAVRARLEQVRKQ